MKAVIHTINMLLAGLLLLSNELISTVGFPQYRSISRCLKITASEFSEMSNRVYLNRVRNRSYSLIHALASTNDPQSTTTNKETGENKPETKEEGVFKLGAKSVFVDPAVPFGSSSTQSGRWREPSPVSDNLILLGTTSAVLFGLVCFFLFLNKDITPPPYA
jgi:hypothetical protein